MKFCLYLFGPFESALKWKSRFQFLVINALFTSSMASAAGIDSMSYEGYLTDTNGVPIESSQQGRVVLFDSAAKDCILYIETVTITPDPTKHDGFFSLQFGNANITPDANNANTFEDAFRKANLSCASGSTRTSGIATSSAQYLQLEVKNSSGAFDPMDPLVGLHRTPQAINSSYLAGFSAQDFIFMPSSCSDGSTLSYDLTSSRFKCTAQLSVPSAGSLILGNTSSNTAGSLWYDSASQTINFSDNSGTTKTLGSASSTVTALQGIPVVATPTSNSLLRYNGSGWVSSTLNESTTGTLSLGGSAPVLTSNGELTVKSADGQITNVGNNASSSSLNLQAGTGGISLTGNTSVAGNKTFSTGTGAVSLNGPTTVAANQNFSLATGTGTFTQSYSGTVGPAMAISAHSLDSGGTLNIASHSTATQAASSSGGVLINIAGANINSSVKRYGLKSEVLSTGTSSTNVGGLFSATGATNNYGLLVESGRVGIGTTTPDDGVLEIDGGSQFASLPIIYGAQSWNNATANFSAATINVTDTASSPSSKLLDLQVGGTSKFSVDKTGKITGDGSGLTGLPGIISGLTAGRVVLSSNATSVSDSNNLTFNSTTGTIGLGGTSPTLTSGGSLTISAGGSNQNLTLSASGTGSIKLMTNSNRPAFSVVDNGGAATVNFLTAQGAASSTSPVLSVDGSDANINLTLSPKGTGDTIVSNGNVGIGTTTPGSKLDVSGTIRTDEICDRAGNNCKTMLDGWVSGSSLADAKIWVGNASNQATAVSLSGDATLANTGGVRVTGIRNVTVSTTAPSSDGQVLRYQTSPTAQYVPGFMQIGDIRSTQGFHDPIFGAATCSSHQTMYYDSLNDKFSCQDISNIPDANITYSNKSPNSFLAGPTTGPSPAAPTFRALVADDIPDLDAAKISSGTLSVGVGGTGLSSYTSGDLLYGGTSNSLDKLALGSPGQVLTSTGTTPTWSSVLYPGIGSNTNPTYSFDSSDDDTGIFSPGPDKIAITTNSTERVIVDSSGNVGIGTSTPQAKLDISGQIKGKSFSSASTTINWNNGNTQTTSASCGAFTFSNMLDGGSYTLAVTGATSATCTFSQAGPDSLSTANFKFVPANGPTASSTTTVYTFIRIGSNVYVSWITGF